jgi:hypothetical protein
MSEEAETNIASNHINAFYNNNRYRKNYQKEMSGSLEEGNAHA